MSDSPRFHRLSNELFSTLVQYVPDDVCETYEAVYEMLNQLSVAYKE